jgi:hypothetical protein
MLRLAAIRPCRTPNAAQAGAGLAQQFLAMHQHADPIAAGRGLLSDVAEDHGFAAAGGQHEQH